MKPIASLILYIFLVVITNPYQGLNYNQINVYDVNYCSDYCYNQNTSDWNYFEEDEPVEDEEWEEDIKDEYEKDAKPLIFPVDLWQDSK